MRKASLLRGFVAGALAGAVGTLVLDVFQRGSLAATDKAEDLTHDLHKYTRQQQALLDGFEKAHTDTAVYLAKAAGTRLSLSQRQHAAPVVEYAFGTLCAGVYGSLAEYLPAVTAGFGTAYGAILFLAASEVVLPALGMVPVPAKRTPVQHLGGLAGNLVYGAATEGVRILVRKAL